MSLDLPHFRAQHKIEFISGEIEDKFDPREIPEVLPEVIIGVASMIYRMAVSAMRITCRIRPADRSLRSR
jgi:hypothetical protein